MTDLVLLEPAQRELEEIAKIHMNLADQIPQKNSTNLILGTLSRLEPFPLSGAQRFSAWRSTARVRFPFFLLHEKKTSFSGCLFSWSGRRESNPQRKLGKLEFYH